MTWYDELYVGQGIADKAEKVIWKIRHNAGQVGVYVIALASNRENILDIIPAQELLQRGYPKGGICVVGLAKGYDEAVDVAASIVSEVYRDTGAFKVREYLAKKRAERAGAAREDRCRS